MKDEEYFERPPRDEINGKRGTGRTYKMLSRALSKALEGVTVYVLAADPAHCRSLLEGTYKLPEFRRLSNVHVSVPAMDIQLPAGQMRFRSAKSSDWDWRLGRFKGLPPGVPVFVDHHTWERELGDMK